ARLATRRRRSAWWVPPLTLVSLACQTDLDSLRGVYVGQEGGIAPGGALESDAAVGEGNPGAMVPTMSASRGTVLDASVPAAPPAGAGSCPAGTGRGDTESACTPCAAGTFSDGLGTSGCTPHATCVPGSFVVQPGSAVTNRSCRACAA